MKNFRFHMQKVLDLKEKETEQAQWAFGKSVQKKLEEEERLLSLGQHRDQVTESLVEMQTEAISASRLLDMSRYRTVVERQIDKQKRTVFQCEQEVELSKDKLTYHRQQSQLWQRLREKSKENFEEVARAHEQKEMDEIGINTYIRREVRG